MVTTFNSLNKPWDSRKECVYDNFRRKVASIKTVQQSRKYWLFPHSSFFYFFYIYFGCTLGCSTTIWYHWGQCLINLSVTMCALGKILSQHKVKMWHKKDSSLENRYRYDEVIIFIVIINLVNSQGWTGHWSYRAYGPD